MYFQGDMTPLTAIFKAFLRICSGKYYIWKHIRDFKRSITTYRKKTYIPLAASLILSRAEEVG